MKKLFGFCAAFLGLTLSFARAGSVIPLTGKTIVSGKVTFQPGVLHVDGAAPANIKWADVLEAGFDDQPFHLDYFSSHAAPDQLPLGWQTQDTGTHNDLGGSSSYGSGLFTLTSNCHKITDWGDPSHAFLVGRPWTGNGQWTAHLKSFDPRNPNAVAGVALWESFENTGKVAKGLFQIGTNGNDQGYIYMRNSSGGYYGHTPTIDHSTWLRLVRNGSNLSALVSKNGKNWDIFNQTLGRFSGNTWAGLFIANGEKPAGQQVMDDVSFTPGPSFSDTLPTGLLLRGGTYLAGHFDHFEITKPDARGEFLRQNQKVAVAANQIAAVIFQPTLWHQIQTNNSQTGLLFKNGDFTGGDIQMINSGDPDQVRINSLTLGTQDFGDRFGDGQVQAAFFNPLEPQPAEYEIRLKDGSMILARDIAVAGGQIDVTDASGLTIAVDPSEIAQFRAGPACVQHLLTLPWTTVSTSGTADSAPDCWEGNDQEQIMVAPVGVPVNFPLNGKFRALALKVTLAPDSSPDSHATVRILADGKELGRTLPCQAGVIQFHETPLPNAKTLTLIADSKKATTRVLLIDPELLRSRPTVPAPPKP